MALRVVQAWKPQAPPIPDEEKRHLDDLIAGWRGKYPDLPISVELVTEHPAAALTTASAGAQLLVVGSRGRGALRGMLLGSVSQHLLRHSVCSIAVVHEVTA
ncbi:nucleotide-binding universal stress UspA family protein [Actinoplanes tereljensis]|uniref:UspA domain-containing protein n=1 Tax=Paractinoplanes tereljensis TaxID=571912 RepID=A0A919NSB8_9ACTN|nr:universal stress protein [Actinoplanes tereljensis]GIF23355.1 hypothetical protein Ate02nite_60850 [Actinoplanes tereljensis]